MALLLENASISNNVYGNVISKNENRGIIIQSSSGNSILNNQLTKNNYGVLLLDSSENILKGNFVSENGLGIDFSGTNAQSNNGFQENTCTNNILVENDITQNGQGITVDSNVAGNIFYQNNFINNVQQTYSLSYNFYSSEPLNSWDNGKEGNYWSNYNGTDANNDGIGDQPLDVFQQYQQLIYGLPQNYPATSEIDHFPLMNPYLTSFKP